MEKIIIKYICFNLKTNNFITLITIAIGVLANKIWTYKRRQTMSFKVSFYWLIRKLSLSSFIPAPNFWKILKIDRENNYWKLFNSTNKIPSQWRRKTKTADPLLSTLLETWGNVFAATRQRKRRRTRIL